MRTNLKTSDLIYAFNLPTEFWGNNIAKLLTEVTGIEYLYQKAPVIIKKYDELSNERFSLPLYGYLVVKSSSASEEYVKTPNFNNCSTNNINSLIESEEMVVLSLNEKELSELKAIDYSDKGYKVKFKHNGELKDIIESFIYILISRLPYFNQVSQEDVDYAIHTIKSLNECKKRKLQ